MREMIELDSEQQAARNWFERLRDRICAEFEAIEREAGSDAAFDYIAWDRTDDAGAEGGGGVRGAMKGRVFEKVGVNVSTVGGAFAPEFAPTIHMNCRFLATTKRWFGGGADLNPPIPYAEDTADFHAALRAACENHAPGDYPRFKQWADDYFWIPHRHVHRGEGGIFFDHLEGGFAEHLAFVRAVGEAFLDVFPRLVRRRRGQPWDEAERARMLAFRGRYAEFNLVYDRGTLFGLKTGGNIDAILMSLPPLAAWD